jgi:hypothetical protein
MKSWKLVLGAGAACAACCAAPIVGAMSSLALGSGLFAGGAGAIGAYSGSWLALAAGGVVLFAAAGVVAWRRRAAKAAAGCGCAGSQPCG